MNRKTQTSEPISGTAAQISLIYGTKAQFIKMMPIVWELERRGIPHGLIDTGQHESISSDLRREYGIRPPDCDLGHRYSNVNTLGRGMVWFASSLYHYAVRGERARKHLFGGDCGIALVHGDTASTVLAAVIAKRAGQKVMHIEAGLRSWSLVNPFPEEMVRIMVMRMSDYLIAPSTQACDNLSAMALNGRSWCIEGNTGLDVIAADLKRQPKEAAVPEGRYCVITIHRMETLYNRWRLENVVETVLAAQEKAQVQFVQHGPTVRRLARYGMLDRLKSAGVRLLDLMAHTGFVHLLNGAEFVITDGGSVQEEASYLGVPCLLMRLRTERADGLGGNVVLSKMNPATIDSFLDEYQRHRRPAVDFERIRPSSEIVDILVSELGHS